MPKSISYYPFKLIIEGKEFSRTGGLLHNSPEALKAEKKSLASDFYCRSFKTGGERLSDGTIRWSYFLLVRPK